MTKKITVICLSIVLLIGLNICLFSCSENNNSSGFGFSITFDANGGVFADGETVESVYYSTNSSIEQTITPSKKGYFFDGWYVSEELEQQADFTTINSSIYLYAKWKEQEADIISTNNCEIEDDTANLFISNTSQSINIKSYIKLSTGATLNLYSDESYQYEITGSTSLSRGHNVFYAIVHNLDKTKSKTYKLDIYQSYNVTLEYRTIDNQLLYSEIIPTGIEKQLAYEPNIVGHKFNYWQNNSEEELTSITPYEPMVVYANISPLSFSILLDANEGSIESNNLQVTYNQEISLGVPARPGFAFMGWLDGEDLVTGANGIIYKWEYTSNKTFLAKWNLSLNRVLLSSTCNGNVYMDTEPYAIVTYDYNDGTKHTSTQTVTRSTEIDYPEIPSRAGYIFRGWTQTKGEDDYYDFSTDLGNDITLYALWDELDADAYYSYEAVNVVGTSSTAYKSISTANTSLDNCACNYFVCYTSGTKRIYYKNSSTSTLYSTRLRIINKTQNQTIRDWRLISSDSFTSVSFTANEGDIIALEVYKYNNAANLYYYVQGAQYPIDGGIATSYRAQKDQNVTIHAENPGYTFLGWFNNDGLISTEPNYDFTMPMGDAQFEARWCKLALSKNNSNAGSVTNLNSTYKAGQSLTIVATTNPGYTWVGWYKGDNQLTTSSAYEFTMPSIDETYTARWCKLTLNKNINVAGSIAYLGSTYVAGQDVSISATTNPGYTWVGWYNGSSVVTDNISDTVIMPGQNATYTATWTSYTITTTSNIADAGTTNYSTTTKITVGQDVTLEAVTNPGYTFVGWYKNNIPVSTNPSYGFSMTNENQVFEARWSINSYTITLTNQAASSGVELVGVISGNSYEYKSHIEITAIGAPSGYYVSWIKSGNKMLGNSYEFTMPASSVVITISLEKPYKKEGSYIYFGSYPQTVVEDEDITSQLNVKAGSLPTSTDSYSWIDYGYYENGVASSYMWYKDIHYNGDKYRGVYFIRYRPTSYAGVAPAYNTIQSNNGYYTSTVYWFKFEQIKWRILTQQGGKAFLLADLILDAQEWEQSQQTGKYTHNGEEGYATNYKLSYIRNWLNDYFYNTAFDETEQSIIETTSVDNSKSQGGIGAGEDTEDKIFLLSYIEATNSDYGLEGNDTRVTKGSDYAKAQGLGDYYNSNWWLRSVSYGEDYGRYDRAYCVEVSGDIYTDLALADNFVWSSFTGVRPACWITL